MQLRLREREREIRKAEEEIKSKGKMEKEEVMRKGPWSEEEDVKLVFYVKLFGDRRWDFVAKVSGLKRSGKSCRLRWVNYLHPGLKRGKMTPKEERLVVDLQSKWGNRWSRIARKLPGRTDNEIKNYWRTHMRKKAQETKKMKKGMIISSNPPSSSSSSSSSSTSSSSSSIFHDTGGAGEKKTSSLEVELDEGSTKAYSMDDIWKELVEFEEDNCGLTAQTVASPVWDYSLWSINEEESKMLMPAPTPHHHFQSFPLNYNYMNIG